MFLFLSFEVLTTARHEAYAPRLLRCISDTELWCFVLCLAAYAGNVWVIWVIYVDVRSFTFAYYFLIYPVYVDPSESLISSFFTCFSDLGIGHLRLIEQLCLWILCSKSNNFLIIPMRNTSSGAFCTTFCNWLFVYLFISMLLAFMWKFYINQCRWNSRHIHVAGVSDVILMSLATHLMCNIILFLCCYLDLAMCVHTQTQFAFAVVMRKMFRCGLKTLTDQALGIWLKTISGSEWQLTGTKVKNFF